MPFIINDFAFSGIVLVAEFGTLILSFFSAVVFGFFLNCICLLRFGMLNEMIGLGFFLRENAQFAGLPQQDEFIHCILCFMV